MSDLSPRNSKTIEYTSVGGQVYTLVLGTATGEIGVYRTILRQHAMDEEEAAEKAAGFTSADELDLRQASMRVLHTLMYPSMMSCVISQTGFEHWPLKYEEFKELDEELIAEWEVATFELNPHWRPVPQTKEAARKKATRSTRD